MRISYIITISPVIDISYLEILITSLNLQSCRGFDVIFYNQTHLNEKELFDVLGVPIEFPYTFYSIPKEYFLGKYPIWDLYSFHQYLLSNDLVSDYFISLHMEEFLDVDYTKDAIDILSNNGFEVLFGNLCNTNLDYNDIRSINKITSEKELTQYIEKYVKTVCWKWGLPVGLKVISKSWNRIIANFKNYKSLSWRYNLKPTLSGFTKFREYGLEDVYLMSKDFAKRYGWFNSPVKLYFEDIHINRELSGDLKRIIEFPVYMNKSKVYHICHGKYYYQLEDKIFSDGLLAYDTDNPILLSIKHAIQLLRDNPSLGLGKALSLTRRNKGSVGSANFNVQFHRDIINSNFK